MSSLLFSTRSCGTVYLDIGIDMIVVAILCSDIETPLQALSLRFLLWQLQQAVGESVGPARPEAKDNRLKNSITGTEDQMVYLTSSRITLPPERRSLARVTAKFDRTGFRSHFV